MSEWDEISLAQAGTWLSGGTPKTSEESFWGGEIPWISAASLKDFYIESSDRNVTELGAANGTRLVPPGTLLFIVRGMSLKSEFRMGITRRTVAFGQDCKAIIPSPDILPMYLAYALKARTEEVLGMVDEAGHGTGRLQTERIEKLVIRVPKSLDKQAAVIAPLKALDDKIAVNERIAATSRELGLTLFTQALLDEKRIETPVKDITSTLTRGITPKYSESPDDIVVLNQKCIRGGRVNLEPSRLTLAEKVKAPKLLQPNDVLVNSTGVGTLGRVARWTLDVTATVDSHITIVRFDNSKVDPVCAGFAMLRAQPEIEALGEGSTGQTELSRGQLGALEITLPSPTQQRELRKKLDSLEKQGDHAFAESASLAALRDTLLPQLMSGRLRVRDAEKIVEDAT
ncbi:MAG: restriction endonuclease subunit S [Thermobispora bispora]|nr:restriction endonuclease subunit S [Thermobispora bispora]